MCLYKKSFPRCLDELYLLKIFITVQCFETEVAQLLFIFVKINKLYELQIILIVPLLQVAIASYNEPTSQIFHFNDAPGVFKAF